MDDNYCTTCGALNSLIQTMDNHCCGECGDTEGIIWDDHPEWDKITGIKVGDNNE